MAARGADARLYPWGDGWDASKCNAIETGIGSTSAVGLFPDGASPCGALDMSGNVLEWCATRWTENYEGYAGKEAVLQDPEGKTPRVFRGGGFGYIQWDLRCACRNDDFGNPLCRNYYVGVRLVGVGAGVSWLS